MKSLLIFLVILSLNVINCDDDDLAATGPPDDPVTTILTTTEAVTEATTEMTTTAAPTEDESVATTVVTTTAKPNEGDVTTKSGQKNASNSEANKSKFKEFMSGKMNKTEMQQQLNAFKNKTKAYINEKKKKLMDVINYDLTKLNLRNGTIFKKFSNDYKSFFNKHYSKEEWEKRKSTFKKTIEKIREHNKNTYAKYKQGINELSDMSFAEILKFKLGFKNLEGDKLLQASAPVPSVDDLPDSWDWRKFGILTEPRNQGKCGSCWSFAAACVIESHNMKRQIYQGKFNPDKKIYVSEQQLIDCSHDYGTIGCDGGMPQQAFKYISESKGMNGVTAYPYVAKKDKICHFDESKKEDVKVEKGVRLKTGADNDLITAVYNYGPATIAIHVTANMAAYKEGIFDDPKCDAKKVNHAVVVVGYTKEYFIVRNSWGVKWGEGGYIKVSRSKVNNCGVSQQVYYPVIPDTVDTTYMKDKLKPIK